MNIRNDNDVDLIRNMADFLCPEVEFREHMRRGFVYGRANQGFGLRGSYIVEGIVVPVQDTAPCFVRIQEGDLQKALGAISDLKEKRLIAIATYVPLGEWLSEMDSSKQLRRRLKTEADRYKSVGALIVNKQIFSDKDYMRIRGYRFHTKCLY